MPKLLQTCEHCKKDFSHYRKQRFCSFICKKTHLSVPESKCLYCKEIFKKHASNSQYCSMDCLHLYNSIELICKTCKNRFRVANSTYRQTHPKYCGKNCYFGSDLYKRWSREYEKCIMCGTRDIPYHGFGLCSHCYTDNRHYGGNRILSLKRDKYCCIKCGLNNSEHIKKYKMMLHCHHKDGNGLGLPIKSRNNNLENLTTLCTACHTRHHNPRKHKI